MQEDTQKLVEKMPLIVEKPVSFEESMKRMNELYETNSFHPPVKEAGPPEDED